MLTLKSFNPHPRTAGDPDYLALEKTQRVSIHTRARRVTNEHICRSGKDISFNPHPRTAGD